MSVEKKIVLNKMTRAGCVDEDFATHLVTATLVGICGSAATAQDAAATKVEQAKTAEQQTLLEYPKYVYPRFNEDWSNFDPKGGND